MASVGAKSPGPMPCSVSLVRTITAHLHRPRILVSRTWLPISLQSLIEPLLCKRYLLYAAYDFSHKPTQIILGSRTSIRGEKKEKEGGMSGMSLQTVGLHLGIIMFLEDPGF